MLPATPMLSIGGKAPDHAPGHSRAQHSSPPRHFPNWQPWPRRQTTPPPQTRRLRRLECAGRTREKEKPITESASRDRVAPSPDDCSPPDTPHESEPRWTTPPAPDPFRAERPAAQSSNNPFGIPHLLASTRLPSGISTTSPHLGLTHTLSVRDCFSLTCPLP